MTTARQIRERAEAAQAAFENEEAKLYRGDGEKRYSDKEHRERLQELRNERRRVCGEALQEAEDEHARLRHEIEDLNNRDLTTLLSTEELQAAAGRKPFIEDELASMDPETLTARLRSVVSSKERPGMFCHLQAVRKQIQERQKDGRAATGLQESARELEKALFGDSAGKELEDTQAKLREMGAAATLANRLQNGARTAAEAYEKRLSQRMQWAG